MNCRSIRKLFDSVIKRIVFLRHLQSEHGEAKKKSYSDDSAKRRKNLRPLFLVMHGLHWIRVLPVKIFVNVASSMDIVMSEVVLVHVLSVLVVSPVQVLRLVVESHIVVVTWLDLVDRQVSMLYLVNGCRIY